VILDGRVTVRHDTSLEARLPDGEPTLSASGRLGRAFASTVTAANSTDAGPLTATIMSTAREREEAAGIRRPDDRVTGAAASRRASGLPSRGRAGVPGSWAAVTANVKTPRYVTTFATQLTRLGWNLYDQHSRAPY